MKTNKVTVYTLRKGGGSRLYTILLELAKSFSYGEGYLFSDNHVANVAKVDSLSDFAKGVHLFNPLTKLTLLDNTALCEVRDEEYDALPSYHLYNDDSVPALSPVYDFANDLAKKVTKGSGSSPRLLITLSNNKEYKASIEQLVVLNILKLIKEGHLVKDLDELTLASPIDMAHLMALYNSLIKE